MATTTETVLIEFLSDFTQLDAAADTLLKTGKIDASLASAFKQTTSELAKQTVAVKDVTAATTPLKKNLDDVSRSVKSVTQSFKEGFKQGVIDELDKAGVTAEEFGAALKKAGITGSSASQTIRQQLRELTEQIAAAKAGGKAFGAEFDNLVRQAGRLRDAMNDANQEIRAVASDTAVFDGLISGAQGIAGAFSIAQGASALFGDESKELQKTLLKVNAAMAILQGLQAVGNVLQKESAALKLYDVVATKAQVAAQVLFSVVVGKSTGVLKAFRIALASTGIGLIILALAALVANFDKIKEAMSGVTAEEKELARIAKETAEIEQKKLDIISDQDNVLKLQGKTEREILNLKIKQVDAVIEARKQQLLSQEGVLKAQIIAEKRNREILTGIIDFITIPLNLLIKTVDRISKAVGKDLKLPTIGELFAPALFNEEKAKAEGEAALDELRKQMSDLENEKAGFQLSIKEMDKKELEDRVARLKAAADKLRAERQKILQDELAALELKALKSEKAGQIEIDIQKKIIAKKAELELNAENLGVNQKKLILEKSLQDQLDIQKKFNEKSSQEALQNLISRNNAELTQLNISNEEKLRLTLENIITAAQIEIDAAQGNASKTREIRKKLAAEVREATLKILQEGFDAEIKLDDARAASIKRTLEKIVASEKSSIAQRIDARQQLSEMEISGIDVELANLETLHRKKLISEEKYNLEYQILLNKRKAAAEKTEEEITKDKEDEAKKRIAAEQKTIQQIIEVAQMVAGVLQTINDNLTISENNKITAQRQALRDAVDAGTITEKEAIARGKRLDAAERRLKQQQAQRDKQSALFTAIINAAAAVVKAFADGGYVLAIIVGALAAAQIALIAARPIPKFGKGKRNQYEGLAEVGETGAELVERNGRMFVAKDRTITWLGAKDKVYNPEETQAMIGRQGHRVNHAVMNGIGVRNGNEFDYEKLAKTMLKVLGKPANINVMADETGFKVWMQEGMNRINYMDKRYHR